MATYSQRMTIDRSTAARILDSTPVKGLLVGLAASQALDWVSIAIYESEDRKTWLSENLARRGRHAYEVGVAQLAGLAGKRLSRRAEKKWGWKLHQAFGLLSGIQYVALRRRYPRLGAGMGLLFGAAFFLAADELLMPLLRWTPGPRAFSWKVHARGAASHLAYGLAAEATARLLDRAAASTAAAVH